MYALLILMICSTRCAAGGGGEIPWCFSQVKGTIEDEVADGEDTDMYYVTCLKVFPNHIGDRRNGGRCMVNGCMLRSTFS